LILVYAYVVSDCEDEFTYLFFLAIFVVLFVFVQRDGDVYAGFGGPGGVYGEPVCWVLVRL
jgi:hypothetical protein